LWIDAHDAEPDDPEPPQQVCHLCGALSETAAGDETPCPAPWPESMGPVPDWDYWHGRDDDPAAFVARVEYDAWIVFEEELPQALDIDALRALRDAAHAVIHALDGTLDDALPFIARLVEIDRRLQAAARRRQTKP
jgi:hypothetical protein